MLTLFGAEQVVYSLFLELLRQKLGRAETWNTSTSAARGKTMKTKTMSWKKQSWGELQDYLSMSLSLWATPLTLHIVIVYIKILIKAALGIDVFHHSWIAQCTKNACKSFPENHIFHWIKNRAFPDECLKTGILTHCWALLQIYSK